ncbi:hypothetical protein ACQYIQ_002594 [Enterobacter hormaechei]|uniref:hypothetical protein n=1 Tax=Enterobacter hormaechei TaxID=158836 RepID=UPI00079806ED|nr:hypothetical protein [Enterobacter hormaechei]MCU2621409.1 hypothetical protein [Enterobacter hormaechei subsp. hoffmannii]SAF04269.1 Uncharacterised protein [Enterobacter hormaechei]VAF11815.1 Uncharacterised protein [Enterobacter hormaechei]VAG19218.1 Uncharacterised protein [Enterobacter hormaechei]VAG45657.1 Uncharacterised protein [Enterobacter hormaechei]
MSTLTKEWLIKTIAELEEERDAVPGVVNEDAAMALAAMKLALVSLEAKDKIPELRQVIYHFRDWNEGFPIERFKADYVISWMLANYPPTQPTAVSVPDGYRLQPISEYDAMCAAMLQGAELVTTANKLPFEQWLSQQTGTIDVECGCVMTEVFFHWLRVAYEAGNSPVIPDGWALVPVEPTEDMIVNGFESEPDESFSDEKEWEAYDAMSGCQQAAHRAKLCWAAMISAAPKPDAR